MGSTRGRRARLGPGPRTEDLEDWYCFFGQERIDPDFPGPVTS
jgi:hypothetical protein